jgi:hypothetical protein
MRFMELGAFFIEQQHIKYLLFIYSQRDDAAARYAVMSRE